MTDTDKDKAEGTANELKGRVKSAVGDITGDQDKRAEGDTDQAKGKLQQGVADLKDKANDLADKVRDQ